jgi:spore germination cell wall hydrolase CwlJ-like protein
MPHEAATDSRPFSSPSRVKKNLAELAQLAWPQRRGVNPPFEVLNLTGVALSRAERCLASAIYFEARGEPLAGQIAVGQVVLNRAFSGFYPQDICEVVYQNSQHFRACQFTFACDGTSPEIKESESWRLAGEIAQKLLRGRVYDPEIGTSTHFHATYVHPVWDKDMETKALVGTHIFFRPRAWGSGLGETGGFAGPAIVRALKEAPAP